MIPIALSVAPAVAQSNPFYGFQPLAEVKQFLQLTDSQLQTILTNNDEYNRWSFQKQDRIRQVQSEIADETGKSPLDPNALGIRYAEIQAICREMKDRANEYLTRNMTVLNQDQKTKLKVLEEALKLAPVISQAQYGNLIGGFTSAPYAFTSSSFGIGGSVIGGIIGPANGCYLPFPVAANRIGGNFGSIPNAQVSQPNQVTGGSAKGATILRNPTLIQWFNTSAEPESPK